jgi:hypothetical protein
VSEHLIDVLLLQFLGESGEALQIVFVFGCMVMQLAIYCWFGEELTYQVGYCQRLKNHKPHI